MTNYTITPTGISDFQVTCNTCGDSAVRPTQFLAEASGNAHRCAEVTVADLATALGTDPNTLREFAPDDLTARGDLQSLPAPLVAVIMAAWNSTPDH